MERKTGLEPATSSLARRHSTTELLPLVLFARDIFYVRTAIIESGTCKSVARVFNGAGREI